MTSDSTTKEEHLHMEHAMDVGQVDPATNSVNNSKKSQTKTRIFTRIVEVLRKTHTPSPRITSAATPFNVPQQRDTDHDEEVWKTP
jgi:hypothetical protein